MEGTVVKIKSDNKLALIFRDDCLFENPREAYDNLGTFVDFHRRYKVGDEHNWEDPKELYVYLLESHTSLDLDDVDLYDLSFEEMEDMIVDSGDIFMKRVYMYDHSGITINTTGFSCPWDSGQLGVIYMVRDKELEENLGTSDEQELHDRAMKQLDGEIETMDNYIRGNVFGTQIYEYNLTEELEQHLRDNGLEIEDLDLHTLEVLGELDEIDSCYGFLGNIEDNGILDYIEQYIEGAKEKMVLI